MRVQPDLDDLLARARAARGTPVAIEASWDGDTTGWFLTLSVITRSWRAFGETFLCNLTEGGDLRLINGQVPPWPEARQAAEIGPALAARLGVPFYFPSPDHPEDECPRWWERKKGRPCRRCGIPLLQEDPHPWRGVCHHCHLEEEREAREATWTPEEKAGPRCVHCGAPAKAVVWGEQRCASCLEKYVDYPCPRCGTHVRLLKRLVTREEAPGQPCIECRTSQLIERLTDRQRKAIREAVQARGRIQAMLVARDFLDCSLGEAESVVERMLRGPR